MKSTWGGRESEKALSQLPRLGDEAGIHSCKSPRILYGGSGGLPSWVQIVWRVAPGQLSWPREPAGAPVVRDGLFPCQIHNERYSAWAPSQPSAFAALVWMI